MFSTISYLLLIAKHKYMRSGVVMKELSE